MATNGQNGYRFKIGMRLMELGLDSFDDMLTIAQEVGVESVWFNRLPGVEHMAALSDAEWDQIAAQVAQYGLKISVISPEIPFKQLHLTELELDNPQDHPVYRQHLDDLVRTMQVAARLDIGAVNLHSFAWPGEYSAGKPTWPMRWLTGGGVIADVDMEKLVNALSPAVEAAEYYQVDLVFSQEPWIYTNTTINFRRVAERLGSQRVKVMWTPSDNFNSGERHVETAGFHNVRPYLHSFHLKNVHVFDGPNLKFEYRSLATGDVDYVPILRQLRDYRCDAVLALATHFVPPGGTHVDAMRINAAELRAMIERVEAEG